MFIMEVKMIDIIWKTTLIYFVILLTLKFMGKREIGELSLFDFVVILLIADLSAVTLDNNMSFYYSIIPIAILAIIQKILAYLSLKSNIIRKIIDGKNSLIVYDGKLNIKEMRKQNYNVSDLLSQIRLKNVYSLVEIKHLYLETNGEVSFVKYDDLNIDDKSYFPIIISGELQKDNLKLTGLKEDWVIAQVKNQGYILKNVYYACLYNKRLFIIKTCNK